MTESHVAGHNVKTNLSRHTLCCELAPLGLRKVRMHLHCQIERVLLEEAEWFIVRDDRLMHVVECAEQDLTLIDDRT